MFYYSKFIKWLKEMDKTIEHISNYTACDNTNRVLFIVTLLYNYDDLATFSECANDKYTVYNARNIVNKYAKHFRFI